VVASNLSLGTLSGMSTDISFFFKFDWMIEFMAYCFKKIKKLDKKQPKRENLFCAVTRKY